MTSVAERDRRKKSRTVAAAQATSAVRDNPDHAAAVAALGRARPTVAAAGEARLIRRKDGLDYLLDKGKIDSLQFRTGERYGIAYRVADLRDAGALRSCLDDSPRGQGGGVVPATDLTGEEWIVHCRGELARMRAAMEYAPELIWPCDLICGHRKAPRELTTVQRQTDEIENALRIALNMIRRHFDRLEDERRLIERR